MCIFVSRYAINIIISIPEALTIISINGTEHERLIMSRSEKVLQKRLRQCIVSGLLYIHALHQRSNRKTLIGMKRRTRFIYKGKNRISKQLLCYHSWRFNTMTINGVLKNSMFHGINKFGQCNWTTPSPESVIRVESMSQNWNLP